MIAKRKGSKEADLKRPICDSLYPRTLEKVIGNCCFYLVPRSGQILYRHDRRSEGFFGGRLEHKRSSRGLIQGFQGSQLSANRYIIQNRAFTRKRGLDTHSDQFHSRATL